MDEIQNKKNGREDQKQIYYRLIQEAYQEFECQARAIQRIEIERRFQGDWESNRQLETMAKRQLKTLHKILGYREELDHIERGARDFDLFTGM